MNFSKCRKLLGRPFQKSIAILSRIKERALRRDVEKREVEVENIKKDIALARSRVNLPDDPAERAEMEHMASKLRAERKAFLQQLLKRRKQGTIR